jgi:plastocyanin
MSDTEVNEPHTVAGPAGVFRLHALDQDDTFSFKFDKPSTYKYICSIHPKMMAAIAAQ